MTENEALKRFIPILGRISAPDERATITRNILERIAGQQTSVMGVSHKHAGVLAWPNDNMKALAFERALDVAVDTGEFVSTIHRADRRHFQIEELSAWPNCPKVDTESPLVFWLGDTAQSPATPAPVVETKGVTTGKNKTTKTLAFEAEVIRLMGYFWDNRTPGTEPTKGELHPLVYNEMLRGKVKSKSGKLNVEMIRGAAKQWTMPVVLPPYIPPAKTGEKRHPFKGDK